MLTCLFHGSEDLKETLPRFSIFHSDNISAPRFYSVFVVMCHTIGALPLPHQVWETEQHHEHLSSYRFAELPRDGKGAPSSYTGMTWSGFRPSDDANVSECAAAAAAAALEGGVHCHSHKRAQAVAE